MTRIATFLLGALFATTAVAADPNHYLVQELHRTLGYPGMEQTGDYLFITNMDKNYKAQVEVFNRAGTKQLAVVPLDHSATFLAAHGENRVIAIGRRSSPTWSSHMTIVTMRNGQVSSRHYNLGSRVIAESAVSDGQNIYFNEKGSRGLFLWTGRGLRMLPFEVSGPGNHMQLRGDKLYVVELRNLFIPGDESLVEFNTRTRQGRRIGGADYYQGLKHTAIVGDLVAGVETESLTTVWVDPTANKIVDRSPVKLGAYGIAAYGNCALVVSDETKTLTFVKLVDGKSENVGVWDMAVAGDRLKQPRTLSVDLGNNRVFVRSNYICSSCSVTQSSVFAFEDQGEMAEVCR